MTAQQAKELTNESKIKMEDVMHSIKSMANSGLNYACLTTNKILEPEQIKDALIELGYSVNMNETHFQINW